MDFLEFASSLIFFLLFFLSNYLWSSLDILPFDAINHIANYLPPKEQNTLLSINRTTNKADFSFLHGFVYQNYKERCIYKKIIEKSFENVFPVNRDENDEFPYLYCFSLPHIIGSFFFHANKFNNENSSFLTALFFHAFIIEQQPEHLGTNQPCNFKDVINGFFSPATIEEKKMPLLNAVKWSAKNNENKECLLFIDIEGERNSPTQDTLKKYFETAFFGNLTSLFIQINTEYGNFYKMNLLNIPDSVENLCLMSTYKTTEIIDGKKFPHLKTVYVNGRIEFKGNFSFLFVVVADSVCKKKATLPDNALFFCSNGCKGDSNSKDNTMYYIKNLEKDESYEREILKEYLEIGIYDRKFNEEVLELQPQKKLLSKIASGEAKKVCCLLTTGYPLLICQPNFLFLYLFNKKDIHILNILDKVQYEPANIILKLNDYVNQTDIESISRTVGTYCKNFYSINIQLQNTKIKLDDIINMNLFDILPFCHYFSVQTGYETIIIKKGRKKQTENVLSNKNNKKRKYVGLFTLFGIVLCVSGISCLYGIYARWFK